MKVRRYAAGKLLNGRIQRLADGLLQGYRIPPVSDPLWIVTEVTWEFLVDLDSFQADLAGSRTWDQDAEGQELRARLIFEAMDLSERAASIRLEPVARKLMKIAEALGDYGMDTRDE